MWNWLGVAVAIVSGIFLSPYLIRKLGAEGYGVWVLVFSLIENYWLFDLGLRSATVKYTAEYRATNETWRINEIVNTGVVYFSAMAVLLMAGSWLLSRHVDRVFHISPAHTAEFQFLIVIIGASWSFGMIFNVFNATLEGFQRFDISSRIWIVVTVIRVAGTAILLVLGYRLMALGLLVVASQLFGYALSFLYVRRVFPEQRFSLRFASLKTFRQLVSYGIHTVTGTIATQLLNQSAPLIIGRFRPVAHAGYYSVPTRLLQYTGDAVSRVALVTTSNASDLQARQEHAAIPRLGIIVNRYCLALFMPVAVFLLVYGEQLIRVWIRDAAYVTMSAPLIPILTLGTLIAVAAQFNSGALLFGLGRHKRYTRALLVEGIALVAGLWFLTPRFGIAGAAWISAILMIIVRGLYTPWLVCRELRFSYAAYMHSIYTRPLLAAVPVFAAALWMERTLLPGRSLLQVLAAAAGIAAMYYAIALFGVIERQHRAMVSGMIARRLKPVAGVQPA
ncbi:MAG TPA: oligosaccharide flippase family protein [Bryobacteraceae bacterium]|nr:oligosaccharide flippase family protein [Bryobacteraceae bacterium]